METPIFAQAILVVVVGALWVEATKATAFTQSVRRTTFLRQQVVTIREGLTLDSCSSSSDCASSRICFDSTYDRECSSSSGNCICVPISGPQICSASSDCESGEACGKIGRTQACASCDAIREADGISFADEASTCSAVCVSVTHLKHLKLSDLVFPEHRRASVLCDTHGSCATPGHMVVFKSHATTMRRYCDMVSEPCCQRVMFVNSPRMRYGLRVDTFTEGLQFTPLAAKYESKLEEATLKLVVYIGM